MMNPVIKHIGGFKKSIYYTDTDSLYIHKKYWYDLVDIGYVGKSLSLGKNEYSNSEKFYASLLAPKIKYCLSIDDFGVILAKRTFKGYSK